MTVKIAGQLPDGERNGLTAVADTLVGEPHEVHVVVALLDCKRITIDHDTGETIPTARVRAIEVVNDPRDGKRLQQLLRRAFERRTGKVVLPLDLEDDLRAAFGDGEDNTT